MDAFSTLLNRENITLCLSIIGSLGAVISAVSAFIRNRKRIKVSVIGYRHDRRLYTFWLLIENRSRLPISVNAFSIKADNGTCMCVLSQKVAIESVRRVGSKVVSSREYLSANFPINLPGLSSCSALILFEPLEQLLKADSKSVTFQVHTNRGKVSQIELSLVGLLDPYTELL